MTAGRVVVVGSTNLDLVVTVPDLPAPGETVLGHDAVTGTGGKGANQAVAAHRLGAATVFVSAIGDDPFGDSLCAGLGATGLSLDGLQRLPGPSGLALIIVDASGTNAIAVSPGANGRLAAEHLRPVGNSLSEGAVLLLQLEIPVGTALAAAQLAAARGARVIVNAAPAPTRPSPELTQLLAHTDVLVLNETEALALLAAFGRAARCTDDEWAARAADLRTLGPDAVVITLGSAGAVFASGYVGRHVPSIDVRVVDTTGAGDAFCGALAAALAGDAPLEIAVERACRAGALATTYPGAQARSGGR